MKKRKQGDGSLRLAHDQPIKRNKLMNRMLTLLLTLLAATTAVAQTADSTDLDAKYAQEMIHTGLPAPDMTLDSVAGTSIQDFRGRYVVLHFWATWCPDCRKDTPLMMRLSRTYNSDSVVFVHISYDKDKATWQNYLNEHHMDGLHYSELKGFHDTESSKLYQVKWIPAMYVINPKGKVLLATVDIKKLQRRLETLDLSQVVIPRSKRSRAPEYPGGTRALLAFLASNVSYPVRAANYGVEGQTVISFVVEKDGTPTGFEVAANNITTRRETLPFQKLEGDQRQKLLEESLAAFAEEALRVVKKMPKWHPGVRYGQPVRVQYRLPVNFRMNYEQDNDNYTKLRSLD